MKTILRNGWRAWSAVAVVALALAAGAAFARFAMFRASEVVPGVYRSGQPDAADLRQVAEEHDLRSVINLRGPVPHEAWYPEEVAVSAELGLTRTDLRFETFDWPPKIETARFIRAYDEFPRPLLVHCESGIDRAGWASATILLLEGASLDEARAHLGPMRGHVCIGGCPLHSFFDEYERWLERSSAGHSAERFRHWALRVYAPGPYDARIALLDAIPRRLGPGEEVVVRVEVENRSPVAWPAGPGSERQMRLGGRVLGPFESLPADVLWRFRQRYSSAVDVFRSDMAGRATEPGEVRRIELRFTAPEEPGEYAIQIDMVDEHVSWFSDLGAPGLVVPFRVTGTEPETVSRSAR